MNFSKLSQDQVVRISGFGMDQAADGYLARPTSEQQVAEILAQVQKLDRTIVLRGAGRSYGDASILPEAVILDISRMNQILSWDPESGVLEAQGGVTLEQCWRYVLEDGWWPPVVSGTMFPTLSGALSMNIHGKNAFRAGPIGEHVIEFVVLTPSGERLVLRPEDPRFYQFISSAGLLGVITQIKLQMKKIHSGDLKVLPLSQPNWKSQFETFERFESDADYLVSWVDCFAKGDASGRGLIHAAWYQNEDSNPLTTLSASHQDLPDTLLGVFPKSIMWRYLKRFNNRVGMRLINHAKYTASKKLGDAKPHDQSLVGFSFLLDYVPHWRNAYLPHGFLQYQCFVPKESAPDVFPELIRVQQSEKMESFLGVMKRHKSDQFLFSHAVDGYSLALDFKIRDTSYNSLKRMCHVMNDIVLQAGGRFYFAKDSTLRPSDVERYLGIDTLKTFREIKRQYDPAGVLSSSLARRLGLNSE